MTEEHTNNEYDEIASKNFVKLSKAAEKSGYKDGAHDGRESVFQASFDIGYEQGFKNAFQLGYYQGLTFAMKQKPNKLTDIQRKTIESNENDLLLKRPTRGQCQICLDQTILEKKINKIQEIQEKHGKNVHETLKTRYKHLNDRNKSET